MRYQFILLLAGVLPIQSNAFACTIQWRDPTTLQAEAQVVVLAEVLSKSEAPPSFRGQDYKYTIKILQVERGTFPLENAEIAYEDLRMHRRGDTVVCPLKTGSGIEHNLAVGSRYRFYLDSESSRTLLIAIPSTER